MTVTGADPSPVNGTSAERMSLGGVVLLKVAVTDSAAFIVTEQPPVPLQAPLHPANVEPAVGVSLSVTCWPLLKLAVQPPPQLIPVGLLVTVPAPVPPFVTVSTKVVTAGLNVAVTDSAALSVTVHVPVPVHPAPLQPPNVEPEFSAAVSTTWEPLLKFAEHVAPQLIPDGLLVTVPVPVPDFVTVKVNVVGLNVADTDSAALIVTVQTPTPEHPAPVQPANVLPLFAVAVSVTCDPVVKLPAQVLGHKIPAGLLDTDPLPVPAVVTDNWEVGLNVAVTVSAAFTVTVQGAVPEHPWPLQPANTEFAPAVAVSVTSVPLAKFAAHVVGQLIPAGLLVTVPAPVPGSVTVSVKFTALNVTVTATGADIVFGQGSVVPKQPPPVQFAKVEPVAAVAVKFTIAPLAKLNVQAPLPVAICPSERVQLIPAGVLVTVPVPFPVPPDTVAGEIASAKVPVPLLKVAVTVVFAVSVTLHVFAVPLQPPPLHPPKTDPEPGVSAKGTTVPLGKLDEHVPVTTPVVSLHTKLELQLTDPYAVPLSATVKVRFVVVLNVAVTF